MYKGYTIQPYSPAAGTGLSSHELNQPGCYRDVKDTTVVGQFKMKNPKPEMAEWERLISGMDHYSVDIAFEYGIVRRAENRLCGCADLQRIYRGKDDRSVGESFALYSL